MLCQTESKDAVSGYCIRQRFGQNEEWNEALIFCHPFTFYLLKLLRFVYLVLESPLPWTEPLDSNSPTVLQKKCWGCVLQSFLIAFSPQGQEQLPLLQPTGELFWALTRRRWQKYVGLQMPMPKATTGMQNSPARAFDTCVRKTQQLRKALWEILCHVCGNGCPDCKSVGCLFCPANAPKGGRKGIYSAHLVLVWKG